MWANDYKRQRVKSWGYTFSTGVNVVIGILFNSGCYFTLYIYEFWEIFLIMILTSEKIMEADYTTFHRGFEQ